MLKPTIVTHRRPHLDEICALWIIEKFWPQFDEADIVFVSTGPTGGEVWNKIPPDTHPLVIYVGVGHGMFDEHKGDTTESAASLVWKETINKYHPRKGHMEAINRIVNYVKKEDMAQFMSDDHQEFRLPAIMSGLYGYNKKDSHKVYEIGKQLMDAIMFEMLKTVSAEKDFRGHFDFTTKWGLAAAVVSDIPGVERLAYKEGYVLLVNHNQAHTYAGFRADPKSKVDLTEVALKVQQAEPKAPWFLHQSKKMLLCGGEITEGDIYSNLTLEQMVELVPK